MIYISANLPIAWALIELGEVRPCRYFLPVGVAIENNG